MRVALLVCYCQELKLQRGTQAAVILERVTQRQKEENGRRVTERVGLSACRIAIRLR